jgi:3-deoxy-manno-octulosonate cytidylyltransferase (CMP-KDO synthetase)
MGAIAIIPARYASTRLPGKPLLDRTGKPLIQHVVEQVRRARCIESVVVATDDERIARAAAAFGAEAVMTSVDCRSGTDRLAEAADKMALPDSARVVNVQGDEPEMPPEHIDRLVKLLESSEADMATLAAPLPADQAADPNRVKVVLDRRGYALYFSRAPIPFDRDRAGAAGYLLHLGVYAYRVGFLARYAALEPTAAEQAEKLEQLRALEHGYRIAVAVVEHYAAGIDTPRDYEAFVARQAGRTAKRNPG